MSYPSVSTYLIKRVQAAGQGEFQACSRWSQMAESSSVWTQSTASPEFCQSACTSAPQTPTFLPVLNFCPHTAARWSVATSFATVQLPRPWASQLSLTLIVWNTIVVFVLLTNTILWFLQWFELRNYWWRLIPEDLASSHGFSTPLFTELHFFQIPFIELNPRYTLLMLTLPYPMPNLQHNKYIL